jgi:hypothetical protein
MRNLSTVTESKFVAIAEWYEMQAKMAADAQCIYSQNEEIANLIQDRARVLDELHKIQDDRDEFARLLTIKNRLARSLMDENARLVAELDEWTIRALRMGWESDQG